MPTVADFPAPPPAAPPPPWLGLPPSPVPEELGTGFTRFPLSTLVCAKLVLAQHSSAVDTAAVTMKQFLNTLTLLGATVNV